MNTPRFFKDSKYYEIFDDIKEVVSKICVDGSIIFILTQSNSIFCCEHTSSKPYEKLNVHAIDIACHDGSFFFVDVQGRIFRQSILQPDNRKEISIKEEIKTCIHGFKTPSRKVKIKSICVSDFGALFLSNDGQLWATGSMPQVSIKSTDPKKVTFFEGRTIYDIGLGSSFAAVLARKNVKKGTDQYETDSDFEEEVFVRECPQCQSCGKFPSPDSICSLNDICPLGVVIAKSSDESSTTSNTHHDINGEASITEDTSSFTDDSHNVKKCVANKTVDSENNSVIEEAPQETENDVKHEEEAADPTESNSVVPEGDKRNLIFDTEAAKHFLTKQLSWVYIGEDYLNEYAEKPSRMIKENMSSLTSLVYEGVKTVGDKVVNLSRHMSGSSDPNDLEDNRVHLSAEDINHFHLIDELQASTSTVASDRDSQNTLTERASMLVACGHNILNSELWMWGDIKYGQLGTGDKVVRSRPVHVSKLIGLGVKKIGCGSSHCAALTLDGRLFMWGRNQNNQICSTSTDDHSSPYAFSTEAITDRIRDVACGSNHTVAYTIDSNLFYIGKTEDNVSNNLLHKIINSDFNDEPEMQNNCQENGNSTNCYHWKLSASDSITFFHKYNSTNAPALPDLSIEQKFLEEMLTINYLLVKGFMKKSRNSKDYNSYEVLCNTFSDVIYFTTVNVLSLWKFTEGHSNELEISMIANHEEQIIIYRKYLEAVCNVITLNGFTHIASVVEIPTALQNLFSDKLPTGKQNNGKKTIEATVEFAFLYPLNRLNTYKCIIQSLNRYMSIRLNAESNIIRQKLNEILVKWDYFISNQDKHLKQALATKLFWESAGKSLLVSLNKNEFFNAAERRFIRDSKSYPLQVAHSGRFSSHWFVLLSDVLIHVCNNSQNFYPLITLWVEPITDNDVLQNGIRLVTPEDAINVFTATSEEKNDWLQTLQSSIKRHFKNCFSSQPPLTRTATYAFTNKIQFYKDAKFSGRWFSGKMHGAGEVVWPDGKKYTGEFNLNRIHGYGTMDIPGVGVYEGYWKDNLQNGSGVMQYASGDVYEGNFKEGLAHGHGMRRQGDFTTSTATLYIGDWVSGVRQGYGVIDDIGKGEKYLGNWSDNKRHGCGLIVTLDGIYYEGVFMQDTLTGHGVMVFENGTHFEGEFKSAGNFCGKGILTLSSGDKIEGSLTGSWSEGVKISNGNLQINLSNAELTNSKPNSFGKLCVTPNQKWNGLFQECLQRLGVSEKLLSPSGSRLQDHHTISADDNKKVWQNVAVMITHSYQQSVKLSNHLRSLKYAKKEKLKSVEQLQMIPDFAQSELSYKSYDELKQYLLTACDSLHHPLGKMVQDITTAFNATYGGVRVHPLLLSHAVKELKSITLRIYSIVRLLFPALPDGESTMVLSKKCDGEIPNGQEINPIDGEVVSASTLLQPVFLPRVHPSLFVLYALHNKQEDDMYWRRLLKWNKQPDISLMVFLGIDQKFWVGYSTRNPENCDGGPYSPLKEQLFYDAVETLQHIKTTFSPIEKLLVIRSTFQQITVAVQKALGPMYMWSMDELFPVFHFVVVRAQILQLGSEIHFIEDFLESCMQNGELGIMFTTLKACYFQILQEKVPINC